MTTLEHRLQRVEKAYDAHLTTEIMELLALLSANSMTGEELRALIYQNECRGNVVKCQENCQANKSKL